MVTTMITEISIAVCFPLPNKLELEKRRTPVTDTIGAASY